MRPLYFIFLLTISIGLFSLPVEAQQGEENAMETGASGTPVGVVANLYTGSIQLIDPVTHTLSEQYLKGHLDHYGSILMDTVITSDGRTAIVSNWTDGKLYFIDISGGFEREPVILGSTFVALDAQDIAITPNDKFALVTAGGFFPNRIAVVDIPTRTHVFTAEMDFDFFLGESISVAADGETVLVTDFFGGYVYSFLLDSNGVLRYQGAYDVLPFWPVNTAISPDGKTVIVVLAYRSVSPVFSLDSPGNLVYHGTVPLPGSAGQSCVFSADGSKAYYLHNDPDRRGTEVGILNVNGPGQVEPEGTVIKILPTRGSGGIFGIEAIGLAPSGNFIYVTNPSDAPGLAEIAVIDLTTKTQIKSLQGKGVPLGIAFGTIKPEEDDTQQ